MISVLYPTHWKDYALLDSGDGERLERFGVYVFVRPDPQVLWRKQFPEKWGKVDGTFIRSGEDRGAWKFSRTLPGRWTVDYGNLSFWVEPTPFKHMGVFPEQAVHWDWMSEKIKVAVQTGTKPKVLNLFGYTGGASVACAHAGALVTHVDASRPSVGWARDNMLLSRLPDDSIRWILEDVLAFVKREVRRGNTYDALIMDPPAFGHGAQGEVWKFHTHFPELLDACAHILSAHPLFVIVNAYAVSVSSLLLKTMLSDYLSPFKGKTDCGELALEHESSDRLLSTGIFGRWENAL
jgi:23S rRNA (cytosine1962-C5)-methyltransferase